MRKQFESRIRIAVYLDEKDFERLKAQAGSTPIAKYAREILIGHSDSKDVRTTRAVPMARGRAGVRMRSVFADAPPKKESSPDLGTCGNGHPLEPGYPAKCGKWGCKFYAFAR